MATANNVMSVAPQSGGARAASNGGRSAKSMGAKDANFGDALGKAQGNDVPSMETGSQGSDTSAMDAMPKDPLAAAIAASSQQESGAAAPQAETEAAPVAEGVAGVTQNSNVAAAVKAMGLPQMGNAQLQTILPQSQEDGAKRQSMLQMLSGQNWRQMGVQNEGAQGVPVEGMVLAEESPLGAPLELSNMTQGDGKPLMQQMPQGQAMASVQGGEPSLQEEGVLSFASVSGGRGEPTAPASQMQQSRQIPQGQPMPSANAAPAANDVMPAFLPGNQTVTGAQAPLQGMPNAQQEAAVQTAPETVVALVEEAPVAAAPAVQTPASQNLQQDSAQMAAVPASSTETEQVEPLREMMHGREQDGQPRQEQQPMSQSDRQAAQTMASRPETAEQAPAQAAAAESAPAANQGISGFQQTMNTVQVSATDTPEAPAAPRQDFDIPGQIVEQARLIRRGENSEMVIHLKPEHLGELTLRVSVGANGAVNASFHSDNAQVRAIIENSLVQLRQELSNQGIKVDNVEVYAGLSEDGLLNGQSQQAWQQGQQGNSSRNRNLDYESYEEETADLAAAAGNGLEAAEGVDYRI